MLTSFFKGYKAEQFVALFVLLVSVFVLHIFENQTYLNGWKFFINPFYGLIIFSLTVFVFWFIIQKNKLLPSGGIKYLVVVSHVCFFPQVLYEYKLLIAALIAALIVRKILSLGSHKEISRKLLDAILLICLGTFFEFWLLGLLVFLYMGLVIYELKKPRFFIIPIFCLVLIAIVVVATSMVFPLNFEQILYSNLRIPHFSLHIEFYKWLLVVVLFLLIAVSLIIFKSFSDFSNRKRQHTLTLLVYALIACVVIFLTPQLGKLSFVYLLIPQAYFICSLLKLVKNKKALELILWAFVTSPVLFHSINLFLN